MMQRFVRDEAGMTMGITVIMVVLIGVMGAGLLTFVSKDLNAVVEVNQGQRALEAADAGVEAAKQQLVNDLEARIRYDGGTDDSPWSYCYNVALCTGTSPTATGSAGMRLDMANGDYARVTILCTDQTVATFKVISEGRSGNARRKVEAIIKHRPAVSMAPTYFSRSDLIFAGNASVDGASFFALGDIDFSSGSFSLGTTTDKYFGSWATTTGGGPYPNAMGSFPNTFNKTARPTNIVGVGAGKRIIGNFAASAGIGTRSFDSASTPRVVPDYDASALPASGKIAFPFRVPTPAEDKAEMDALRQRALQLEQQNPGVQYFIDSIPGNGQEDAGMPTRTRFDPALDVLTWPSNSNYETVVFYKFQTYHVNNRVSYKAGPTGSGGVCPAATNYGVMMVENGDMVFEGSRRFDGGLVARAYDASGNLLTDVGGLFNAAGSPCLFGYINTSGDQTITGSISPGSAPGLGDLNSFRGKTEVVSWRELYE